MKIRVFKKPSGGVVYNTPSKRFQDNIDLCPVPNELKDLEYFVVEDLPESSWHEQVYCENNILKVDHDWVIMNMPEQLVKIKYLNKVYKKLDDELSKGNPDPISVVKIQRDIVVAKEKKASIEFTDRFWVEKAIEGLDERVAKGEADKPEIRKKLQDKLKELKGE